MRVTACGHTDDENKPTEYSGRTGASSQRQLAKRCCVSKPNQQLVLGPSRLRRRDTEAQHQRQCLISLGLRRLSSKTWGRGELLAIGVQPSRELSQQYRGFRSGSNDQPLKTESCPATQNTAMPGPDFSFQPFPTFRTRTVLYIAKFFDRNPKRGRSKKETSLGTIFL